MKNYTISTTEKAEYQEITDVWEASVRATHDFLKEEDILYFKPLILNQYLDAVQLRVTKSEEGKIVGFVGAAEQNLEMLFIHPDYRGQGIGKQLLNYALEHFDIKKVDVNEANTQALGFYEKMGFVTTSRSELDATGKPYPVLHMDLA